MADQRGQSAASMQIRGANPWGKSVGQIRGANPWAPLFEIDFSGSDLTLVWTALTLPALHQFQKRLSRVRQRRFAPVDEPQNLLDLHPLHRDLDQLARLDFVLNRQPRQNRYTDIPHHEILDRF